MIPPPAVVVIGGGMAGLTAARTLVRRGLRVTLLERSGRFGGTVDARMLGGFRLDSGAESFSTRSAVVPALAEELGLTGRIVTPDAPGAWVQLPGEDLQSAAQPLPSSGVLGIPADPTDAATRALLGPAGALRAARDADLPPGPLATRPHVSLGELVRTRMGEEVLTRLVAPVAGGVFSADPDDLDVDSVAPGLRSTMGRLGSLGAAAGALRQAAPAGSAVAGLVGGMAQLRDALVQELLTAGVDLRTAEQVSGLTRDGAGWTLATEHAAGRRTLSADGVVVATEGGAAVDLMAPALPALLPERPGSVPGVALVTLIVDSADLDAHPRGTGVLVARGVDGVAAKALTHATAKWAWLREQAGPGVHVLRLSFGRVGDTAEDVGLLTPDADLYRHALADASALLGVRLTDAAVLDRDVVRGAGALPHASVGHRERVERIRAVVADAPALAVTGGWLAGTGLVSVIGDARRRADQLADALGAGGPL
ncbi:protoporphyrinogen oxidase [Arthrobacter sp. RIT-PI-e]|uniref:protoporphyrinogen oxidase n=1 Tax=Arthrobacter sp. RIT-PI-e TaxID=1681197 RepID=UPI0006761316|nr:protoporphyrinogen oxidase [Arthrobacter sp. RIT-PI-e]KNC20066.1 protoporphyrinogen oxidase [Arthrobacter sp. RIT-PI-e]